MVTVTSTKDSDLELRQACFNDLYLFYANYVSSYLYPDYCYAPHIDELADELTKLHQGEFKYMCISCPPQHSKSTMATITFPLWCIFQNPNIDVMVITSDEKLALKMGDKLRQCVRAFGNLFGVQLARDKKSISYFRFEDLKGNRLGGSVSIESGLGAGITGNKIDLLIIDDPYHDDIHEFSPVNLQKKIDWFEDKIIQRIRPQTKMIILHTRYHSNDIIGYLKTNSSDYYRFVEMPVIKEDGTLLWEQNRDWEWLEFIKANTSEASFQARYMQQPLDLSTNFFRTQNFIQDTGHFMAAIEEQYSCCRSWDFAFSDSSHGDNRDYTVGVPMSINNRNIYIYDYIRGQFGENNEDLKNTAIPVVKQDGFGVMQLLEFGLRKGASKTYYDVWDKDYLKDYPTQQSAPEGTKEIRAMPLRDAINDGRVHLCISDDKLRNDLIGEFESFPYGKHDDIVDAVSHGFNYLNGMISPDVYAVGSFNVKDYTKTNMILRNILNE